jgi:RNA polymerase sigma-70 factor (ECF subfamily)
MKLSNVKTHRPEARQSASAVQSSEADFCHLLCKVKSGDQQAFAEIYESTKALVFGFILRIVSNHATAEDILLEVYLQAWQQVAKYDAGRGSLLSWLITIARSRSLDRLRSEKYKKKEICEQVPLRARSASPEETSLLDEQQRLVHSAFVLLPLEQRTVIELAYYYGLTQTEIAEKLDCPLGTIKTRTRLAMMKLRSNLLSPVND